MCLQVGTMFQHGWLAVTYAQFTIVSKSSQIKLEEDGLAVSPHKCPVRITPVQFTRKQLKRQRSPQTKTLTEPFNQWKMLPASFQLVCAVRLPSAFPFSPSWLLGRECCCSLQSHNSFLYYWNQISSSKRKNYIQKMCSSFFFWQGRRTQEGVIWRGMVDILLSSFEKQVSQKQLFLFEHFPM